MVTEKSGKSELITVIEALREQASRNPDSIALIANQRTITYSELWARAVAVACNLSERGIEPGHRILLVAPSVPEFAYGYFGAHLIGAIVVALDPSAPPARTNALIERVQPKVAFTAGALTGATCPVRSIEELGSLELKKRDFTLPSPDLVADLMFTTGTTGRPKGVRLTHGNLFASASHINEVIANQSGDVEVVPLPLNHSFGLGRLRCNILAGGTVVLVKGFRMPGEIFTALERNRATGLVGVPAGFAVLLRFGKRGLGPFAGQLRYIEIGSAPMPLEHKHALMELLPQTRLFMHYGLTEASRSTFIEFHRDRDHLDTVGKPAPRVRVEIRDEEGAVCTPGQVGMLWLSGAHIAAGYWEDQSLTASVFRNGWVRTGDMARLDENGFVYLHGRKDDMINVGGFNVWPDEVEQVLEMHPSIQEAGCVGMTDPRQIAGQVVAAYLVAKPGQASADDHELSEWVASRLEPYKVPAQYHWVSALPRSASGKLLRAQLRGNQAGQ
jgi:long-chain acyl-CoA synthetase